MNEPPPRRTWTGSPWKILAVGILYVLILNQALYFTTHSRLAKLRADLRSRGFKLSLGELAASREGPLWHPQEMLEAVRELQQQEFPRLGAGLRLMKLGPPGTLV